MKSQMTIGKKLSLSFGAVVALLLVVGSLSLHDIDNLGGMIDKLSDVNGKKLFLSGQIEVRPRKAPPWSGPSWFDGT